MRGFGFMLAALLGATGGYHTEAAPPSRPRRPSTPTDRDRALEALASRPSGGLTLVVPGETRTGLRVTVDTEARRITVGETTVEYAEGATTADLARALHEAGVEVTLVTAPDLVAEAHEELWRRSPPVVVMDPEVHARAVASIHASRQLSIGGRVEGNLHPRDMFRYEFSADVPRIPLLAGPAAEPPPPAAPRFLDDHREAAAARRARKRRRRSGL